MDLFRKKDFAETIAQTKIEGKALKKDLSYWHLAFMGVSVVVGAGVFSVFAKQSATVAGPSVILSFVLAAFVCILSVLCYAELASSVPASGTAYTFSYLTYGELIAWIIGWDMILEALMAAGVIAQYWGVYFYEFFAIKEWRVTVGPFSIDLVVLALISIITLFLIKGTKLSATVSMVITIIKIGIILFIVIMGAFYVNSSNWHPFIPPAQPSATATSLIDHSLFSVIFAQNGYVFGVHGIILAAATLFFAFVGFDFVATSTEETKNPKRDIPIGLLLGVSIVTVLYIAVALVTTGMAKYSDLANYAAQKGTPPNLAMLFDMHNMPWASKVISLGALLGLTTVVIICLYSLTRTVFAISRDGLLPKKLSSVSQKTMTPVKTTVICGLVVAVLASFSKAGELDNMINIGTLSSFTLVSFAIPIARKKKLFKPAFKVPLSPILPIISGLICFYLMLNLEILTWIRFVVWLAIGFIVYFGYSRFHADIHVKKKDLKKKARKAYRRMRKAKTH